MIRLPAKKIVNIFSLLLIFCGVGILLLTFGSPLFYELQYQINKASGVKNIVREISETNSEEQKQKIKEIVPVNTDFSIIIPKINANAPIFANVNPFDQKEFAPVLKKGVAHAKGTSFPGNGKNIYLFAHSTDAFFNVGRYNAVFYLIGKLEEGDEIDIYYRGGLSKYGVFEKKIVSPESINYLEIGSEEILTLQTCYPPGTTLKRLVVRAKPE